MSLVCVINAGTTTVKCEIYSTQSATLQAEHSVQITQHTPQEGWVEHDPKEVLSAVRECLEAVVVGDTSKIACIGITNQRETSILWNKTTGEPFYNAIAWNDIRVMEQVEQVLAKAPDNNKHSYLSICGLPISPLSSAFKIKWLYDHVKPVKKAVKANQCLFGTIDTWILWNLTGGKDGGVHLTEVSNASRTFLMNIDTLNWDAQLLHLFNIDPQILPEIRNSSGCFGRVNDGSNLNGIPISGILGNQQSALLGHNCFKEGEAKNTYRSGCFLLYNTGSKKVISSHGLSTTVVYKLEDQPPIYALEGDVAVASAAFHWLRDNMGLIKDVQSDADSCARDVVNTGDVYFVPAFKGLYAPYWRQDARGIICGMTAFTTKKHIVRAAFEAICFQTRDILEAMHKDCGIPLSKLYADGTLTESDLLMQLQADISGIPVLRTQSHDVSSLGAAMMAGAANGINIWDLSPEVRKDIPTDTFLPTTTDSERDTRYEKWKKAVQRSLGWVSLHRSYKVMTEERYRLLSSIPAGLFIIGSFGVLLLAEMLKGGEAIMSKTT